MSTTQNPFCVCDVHNVTPADQVFHFQRSTNWEDLQPEQPADQMDIGYDWPVYLIHVPHDWEPTSPSALPPAAKRFSKAIIAAEVTALLNRDILNRSKSGKVQSWHIRIGRSSRKQGVVSLDIPSYYNWFPANEYEMPPAHFTMKGGAGERNRELALMNRRLFDDSQQRTHRAYVGLSIEHELKKQKVIVPKPETADELLKRHGLEIHQVNVEQRDQWLSQLRGEIR